MTIQTRDEELFHFQKPTLDWPRAVKQLPAGYAIKAVDNIQLLDEVKRYRPDLLTILRHHYDSRQIFGGSLDDCRRRAREFFETFVDGTFLSLAASCDFVEEWNEYNAASHSPEEVIQRTWWARAVAEVWKNEYRTRKELAHIRLILANCAVGNDIPLGTAQVAAQYDAGLGYHGYIPVRKNAVLPNEADYYSMRWVKMDEQFRAAGFRVPFWAITEWGSVLYYGNPPYVSLGPQDGWRHPDVHNGDIEQYLNTLAYWLNKWAAWNAAHGDRCLAPVLFTSGGSSEWKLFELQQPEMDRVAQFAANWKPGTPQTASDCVKFEPYRQTIVLHPESPKASQRAYLLKLLEDGLTVDGAWRSAGFVGWSHANALEALCRAISAGKTDSRLIILHGESIGTGLDRNWMENNCPFLLPYTRWIQVPTLFTAACWPTEIQAITQKFGARPEVYAQYSLPGHEGLDFAGEEGSEARAVAGGSVTEVTPASSGSAYGNHVHVHHGNNHYLTYCHLKVAYVAVGDYVRAGAPVGEVGTTGNSTGPHLHITYKRPGQVFLDVRGIRWPSYIHDPSPLFVDLAPELFK